MSDLDWTTHAMCKGKNDLMFPHRGDNAGVLAAKAICADCPVKAECLEYSLDLREKFGIWGGYSAKERRRMMTKRYRQRDDRPIQHGTYYGYLRELQQHKTPCSECLTAAGLTGDAA